MALTKIINDENKSYRPVLTDKLVLDAKPTVNSFNAITSDAVARAVAGASGDVPQVTESDNGKVLGAIYDEGGAAVEWVDPPVALPEYDASDDGKVLGVVVEGVEQTASVDWVDPPVSNVTTSDKQFTVGVNGTGLPITVDCSGATEVIDTGTITENGTAIRYQSSYPAVKFAMANLTENNLGSGTATLTIPEDVTFDSVHMGLGSPTAGYLDGTNSMYFCTLTSGMVSSNKINAGTYTISGSNSNPSVYDDGIGIFFNGGGDQPYWDDFKAALDEAVQSWTISYSGESISGYNFTPASFPSLTGNANKVLKVNSGATGVEWSDTQLPEEKSLASANNTISITEGATTVSIDVANPLPASTSADENKVLTVNAQGAAEWATSQGGGGSSDVFIVEDSTTQGDVYTAYTSGKVLFYKASSGEMYYMSSSQFSTSSQLYLFGAYVGGYGSRATVVHFDAYINLANGAPAAPTAPFSSALGNIETIQTPPPLPTYSTTTDVGKVLQVTANGLAWVSPT